MDVRVRMNEYLSANGIKKAFVANKIGISPQHFSNWLNGRFEISKDMEMKVVKFLKEVE